VSGTSVADLLVGKRMIICAGPGGVGKTTTAAAVAMGMASRGLRVAVVTIDPARRLANSLGLDTLSNEPALVDPVRFTQHGVEMRGELWAMMLDAKRTFDALIERLAPDDRTRDEILANRIYSQISSAVAGSQEFTAIAKLYELDSDGRFDLIVLDTPPSRDALDFLDAPDRLTGFFQGRAIRMFLRPAGLSGKLFGRGTSVVFALLKRVTGVDLLQDLSVFFRSLGGMIDSFSERAARVKALLRDPGTTFLLVTSPEREPVAEAIHFHRKLIEADMPFGGLVVNRLREADGLGADGGQPAGLAETIGDELARRVALSAAGLSRLAARDAQNVERLRDTLGGAPTVLVPQLEDDVHDVEGLARVLEYLFSGVEGRTSTSAG